MQPNLLRNRCFLPTKNKKYRTFYRTHFLLISITCLSRYISLSFYRPALVVCIILSCVWVCLYVLVDRWESVKCVSIVYLLVRVLYVHLLLCVSVLTHKSLWLGPMAGMHVNDAAVVFWRWYVSTERFKTIQILTHHSQEKLLTDLNTALVAFKETVSI